MSIATATIPGETDPCAGVNLLFQAERTCATMVRELRHHLGPEAPPALLAIEGAHWNRATSLEQILRNQLLLPVEVHEGLEALAALGRRLSDHDQIGESLVLLREIERTLGEAYDTVLAEQPEGEKADLIQRLAEDVGRCGGRIRQALAG